MGMRGTLARLLLLIGVGVPLTWGPPAIAAVYPGSSWFINAFVGYDSNNPTSLNTPLGGLANIQGVIASRLQVERGLIFPDWSHWIEGAWFYNSITNRDVFGGALSNVENLLSYFSVIPVGGSFWFFRSAYVDIGTSFGIGAALGINNWVTIRNEVTNVTTITYKSALIAPVVDARLQGRIWVAKYFALDGAMGVRFLGTSLKDSAGNATQANLLSLSVFLGGTFAFGGVKGVGRSYADVIQKATPTPTPSPSVTPAAGPATTPTGLKPAAPSLAPIKLTPPTKAPARKAVVR